MVSHFEWQMTNIYSKCLKHIILELVITLRKNRITKFLKDINVQKFQNESDVAYATVALSAS